MPLLIEKLMDAPLLPAEGFFGGKSVKDARIDDPKRQEFVILDKRWVKTISQAEFGDKNNVLRFENVPFTFKVRYNDGHRLLKVVAQRVDVRKSGQVEVHVTNPPDNISSTHDGEVLLKKLIARIRKEK